MEINITEFLKQTADTKQYFNSIANSGNPSIGKVTWNNACRAEVLLLDTDDKIESVKRHIELFGAWERDEIDSWSVQELNGLFIQLICSELEENQSFDAGRIFKTEENEFYYYVGE
jgi:hypothetical protein